RRELPGKHCALAADSLGDVETLAVRSAALDHAADGRERRETRVDLVAERLHIAFGVVDARDLERGPQTGDERSGCGGRSHPLRSAQRRAGALEQRRRVRIDVEWMLALGLEDCAHRHCRYGRRDARHERLHAEAEAFLELAGERLLHSRRRGEKETARLRAAELL